MGFVDRVGDILQDYAGVVSVLSILMGIINCYFGYKIFKIVLGIVGFAAGFLVAGTLGMIMFGGETSVSMLLAFFGGIIGAFFMVMFYKFGIFILGAGLGALISVMITGTAGQEASPFLMIGLALAGGIVALILQKIMIIVATAFGGSWGIVSGIFELSGRQVDLATMVNNPSSLKAMGKFYYILLFGWLVIGLSGVFFQSMKKKEPAEKG